MLPNASSSLDDRLRGRTIDGCLTMCFRKGEMPRECGEIALGDVDRRENTPTITANTIDRWGVGDGSAEADDSERAQVRHSQHLRPMEDIGRLSKRT